MPQSNNTKHPLLYSLQIWITCAAAGPVVWYWIDSYGIGLTFNEFYWIGLLVGLVYTFPSFLLLFAIVVYVNQQAWELISKRLIVAGSALVFEIASCLVYFQFMHTPPAIKEFGFSVFIAYSVPLFLAIFLYRFPQRRIYKKDNQVFEDRNGA
jgi:hypothetical protein